MTQYLMSDAWTPEELEIFALFSWMCGVCRIEKAITLHEIVPKSKRPKDWRNPRNRIPVCSHCHVEIHRQGINRESITKLQKIRDDIGN